MLSMCRSDVSTVHTGYPVAYQQAYMLGLQKSCIYIFMPDLKPVEFIALGARTYL